MDGKTIVQEFVCKKCKNEIFYNEQDIHYDESGSGYSTKYVECPYCGNYHVVEYIEDYGLYVNEDLRYFI